MLTSKSECTDLKSGWDSMKQNAVLSLFGLWFYFGAGGLSAQTFNYDQKIGLAVAESDQLACISIKATGLAADTRVTLLWVPPKGSPGIP